MLLVRQAQAEEGSEPDNSLSYECLDNGQVVGRLVARWHEDGGLHIEQISSTRREAPRALLAKLERDAISQGLTALYLHCHNADEVARFEPAGYDPLEAGGYLLIKRLG